MMQNTTWKTDNYKFVGKAFDYAYANRLGKLLNIIGTASADASARCSATVPR